VCLVFEEKRWGLLGGEVTQDSMPRINFLSGKGPKSIKKRDLSFTEELLANALTQHPKNCNQGGVCVAGCFVLCVGVWVGEGGCGGLVLLLFTATPSLSLLCLSGGRPVEKGYQDFRVSREGGGGEVIRK